MRKRPHINNLVYCKSCPLTYCLLCQPKGCKCGEKRYLVDHGDIKGSNEDFQENKELEDNLIYYDRGEQPVGLGADFAQGAAVQYNPNPSPELDSVQTYSNRFTINDRGAVLSSEALRTAMQTLSSGQIITGTASIHTGTARDLLGSTGDGII